MKYPKINFYTDNSNEMEAVYLCYLAKGITTKTYQNGNFHILPTLVKNNPNAINFPDLGFSEKFWRLINNNPNPNFTTLYPKFCIKEVQKLLSLKSDKYTDQKKKIINDWKGLEKVFFKDVNKFLKFSTELNKITEINILLTPYGTRSSFYTPKKAHNLSLWITLRIDFPASNIANSILHLLYILKTRYGGEIGSEEFTKRMEVIKFLANYTIFSKYIKNNKNILSVDAFSNQKLISKSHKYLKKLGFPMKKTDFNKIRKTLTTQEEKVLNTLITANTEIVSFGKIADILWGEQSDEKYSLEAISKVIQNLRDKIRLSRIHKNLIHTVRKKGYFLEN